ncbi:MAG TPA: choice-of-anchor D domain-containing protein [Terriglobales bacterium]|nr:choice-of-anchor D domain-containing protein [Terriglobales bacterium]
MSLCFGRSGLAVLAMAFVALGAPAQDEGDGQSAVRARGRDRAAEKQAWFLSGRSPKGGSAAELLRFAWQQKQAMRRQSMQASAAAKDGPPPETSRFLQLQWTSLGPRPIDSDPTLFQSYGFVTGRVTSIVVDQKDVTGNTVYVGSANGGVWKSTNAAVADFNAVAWQPLTDEQASLAIGALAIQPGASGNVILAGTGEANNSTDSYYGAGMLRSTDGGQSWTNLASANAGARSFRGLSFSRIAFHSGNPNVVVAGTSSSNGDRNGADVQAEAGRGIYYSVDAGLTWTYATMLDSATVVQPSAVTDIVFNPVHNKFYAAVRGHGYYESSNGQSWTRMAQQPGSGLSAGNCPASTDSTCPLLRGQLAVRAASGEVYTAWIDRSETLSVYKLPSNGAAWQAMGKAGIDNCGDAGPDAGCGAQQGGYNLTLQAVPDGDITNLYFGAVNLFKCRVLPFDTLCTSPDAWKNLTHAYGCSPLGAPAHVHPGQHGIDFSVADPNRLFLANDGGVYRTLSSLTLNSAACTANNAFENLNANLGPLSQFVSLAQPVGDVEVLLGGAMANGSPIFQAGNAGSTGALWRAANLGDGGYAAIDPGNANVLYTSFPAGESSTIQRCAIGVNCRQNTWTTVADASTFANDGSAFVLPYLLDPKNPGTLMAATCRLWRGPANGGSFSALSNVFSGQDAGLCSGGTITGETKIRSLAAGGPMAPSGNAKLIYAGMMGRSGGASGRIFVTTDSDAGAAAWNDRTSGINPSEYDIADIAISPFDASGNTAYATIMGFGVGHIFKTTNAGISWSDKTGNLPDVPVNSIAIDPLNSSLLYAGTDMGMFVSADDGNSWSELGTGLPNVPVMKILTFVSGGTRKLRAATYGRGVWQIDLPEAAVKVSAAMLNFNATVVGRTSAAQFVTLTNDSISALTFTGVAPTGGFRLLQHDCPATLAVGASCQIGVTFQPASSGPQSGNLNIGYNPGSKSVPLSGTGVDFVLSLSRPVRPLRGSASATVMVSGAVKASFEIGLRTSEPINPNDIELECRSSLSAIGCSIVRPQGNTSTQFFPAVVILERKLAGPRPRRLLTAKPIVGTTYLVTIRAVSGTTARVMEVPFEIR